MLNQVQIRSLELLDSFIANTSTEEVNALVDKYANIEIESPTIDEYFYVLNTFNFRGNEVFLPEGCRQSITILPDRQINVINNKTPAFCGGFHLLSIFVA